MRQFRLSKEIRQLESTIHELDKKIQSNIEHEALIAERNYAKDKLDILYEDKAIGAQIRSKVKYIEEGVWFVLFNDTWSQEGHSVSCMTILFTSKCKSSDQTSGHT